MGEDGFKEALEKAKEHADGNFKEAIEKAESLLSGDED